MNWYRGLQGRIKKDVPLKKITTFKIGGRVDFLISPKDTSDLEFILRQARINKIKTLVIGSGSNILAGDRGLDRAVIALNSDHFKRVVFKGNKLYAGAGALLSRVVLSSRDRRLSGLEFLIGIPGTIGGALVMNAGAQNQNIAKLVEKVSVMDYNGRLKTLAKKKIKFGYRQSGLRKYIVLGAVFRLSDKDRSSIRSQIKDYLLYRNETQDYAKASAGCVFRNPPGESAGRMIDACGLKGKKIGDAQVSLKHANFIVNNGKAKAEDVLRLMDLIKKEVKRKFRINLEPEIKIWK